MAQAERRPASGERAPLVRGLTEGHCAPLPSTLENAPDPWPAWACRANSPQWKSEI